MLNCLLLSSLCWRSMGPSVRQLSAKLSATGSDRDPLFGEILVESIFVPDGGMIDLQSRKRILD